MTRKHMFAVALAACAFATPAFAQTDNMMMKDGMMMMIMPDGRMSTMQSSDKSVSEMMMKDGKTMNAPMMMMMSGGKMHMMEDKKMSDGKMMSDQMKK